MKSSIVAFLRNPWIFLTAVTIAALCLRMHNLGRLSLWIDEGYTVWKIKQPYSRLFFLNRIDTVPPLYYYLLKAWVFLFGEGDYQIRLLSALLGAATCVVTYFIGKTLLDQRSALAASALVALSALHIQYSQEARSYALLVFLFGLTWYFLSKILTQPNRVAWIGYAASGTLLMYTHGISLFYFAALNLFLVAHRSTWNRKTLVSLALANGFILVCCAPWLSIYAKQIASFQSQTTLPTPGWTEVFSTLVLLASFPPPNSSFLPTWLQSTDTILIPIVQLSWITSIAILFAAPAFLIGRSQRRSIPSLYLLFALPFIIVFGFSVLVRSIYLDRLFIVCVLPLSLLLGANLIGTAARMKKSSFALVGLYAVCCAFSIKTYYLRDWKEDYRAAVAFLVANAHPEDVLVFVAHVGELHFDWYSKGKRPDLLKVGLPEGIYERGEPEPGLFVRERKDLERLNQHLKAGRNLWLVKSHTYNFDPEGLTEQLLMQRMTVREIRDFPGIQIVSFSPLLSKGSWPTSQ